MGSQQALYEAIHDDYSRHLYDPTSNAYRDTFINSALFEGLDLESKQFAEIMCGNGQATLYARDRFPNARCQGFDISRAACAGYTRWTGAPGNVSDIIVDKLPAEAFDVIAVVGGLHHVGEHVEAVIRNVHQALKPSGVFTMMEPNKDYFLEAARRLWYRNDRYFDANMEAAISYPALRRSCAHLFEERSARHLGGPAYFLILMSMVLRVPLGLKPYIAPPLMRIERAWNLIPARQAHAIFVAQWKKR
jgi:SAM-dependent methyltransferase